MRVKRNNGSGYTNNYVDLFLQAAGIWNKLTGVSYDQTTFKSLGEFSAYITNNRLRNAIELDPEGFLPIIILHAEFNKYCKDRSFKVYDMLYDKDCVEFINNAKKLLEVFNKPIIVDRLSYEKDKFFKVFHRIKGGNYLIGDKSSDSAAVLDIGDDLFIDILYEAKLAAKTLRIDQFSRGKKSGCAPVLSNNIYQCYSVHDFISAISKNSGFESVVALCLIRDVLHPLFSYFVIGIRNGQRVYIVSDKPREPHPLYKVKTRRPGRSQGRRMEEFWFPYYLLEFELDHRGDLMPSKKETGLVLRDKEFKPLCEVKALRDENLLWLVMLYESLVDKFFVNDYESEELSYTGDMVNVSAGDNEIANALAVQGAGCVYIDIPSSKEIGVAVKDKGNFKKGLLNNKNIYSIVNIDAAGDTLVPITDGLQEVELNAEGITASGYAFDRTSFGTKKSLQRMCCTLQGITRQNYWKRN